MANSLLVLLAFIPIPLLFALMGWAYLAAMPILICIDSSLIHLKSIISGRATVGLIGVEGLIIRLKIIHVVVFGLITKLLVLSSFIAWARTFFF